LDELFYEQVDQIVSKDQNAIIHAVIPLLIETRRQSMFDFVIMVYAPRNIQLQRLMARDKNDAELASAIIDAQMSVEEKKKQCDFVIDNTGPLAVTKEQVDNVWQKLKEIQNKRNTIQ
jgi:dephospho-CoA kinase